MLIVWDIFNIINEQNWIYPSLQDFSWAFPFLILFSFYISLSSIWISLISIRLLILEMFYSGYKMEQWSGIYLYVPKWLTLFFEIGSNCIPFPRRDCDDKRTAFTWLSLFCGVYYNTFLFPLRHQLIISFLYSPYLDITKARIFFTVRFHLSHLLIFYVVSII